MKKITSIVFFIFFTTTYLVCQIDSLYNAAYQQFNVASPFSNQPFEIIKGNDDSTFIAFLSAGVCPSLVVKKIQNGLPMHVQYQYGDRYSNFKIKSKNNLWLAIFELQYIDDVGGSEEVFIREKGNDIIISYSGFENLDAKELIYYHDFTFVSDSTLLCVPSFRKYPNESIVAYSSQLFIIDFEGKILDSIANPISDLKRLEKTDDGFIGASSSKLYELNDNFEIINEQSKENIDKILLQQSTFCVITNDSTLSIYSFDNFEKLKEIENIVDVYQEEDIIYYLSGNAVHFIDVPSFEDKILIPLLDDKTVTLSQLALKEDYILLSGKDNYGYEVSEFRAYRENGITTTLNDLSISATMDSFTIDTFMIHDWGQHVYIEYDNFGYFTCKIKNNGNQKVDKGIVYSDVYGGINCSQGFYKKEFFNIEPGESLKFSDSIRIRTGLSFNLCLELPSSDDRPDKSPSDNKSCVLLTSVKFNSPNSQDFTINPNPASAEIEIGVNDKIKTEIYDINGNLVLKADSNLIEISHLIQGTYIAKIQNQKGNIVRKKFIKI